MLSKWEENKKKIITITIKIKIDGNKNSNNITQTRCPI